MLRQFSNDDVEAMIENHKIGVTCEFCNTHYSFDEAEVAALTASDQAE
jgi:redox-regulated HSP33 family molecular chaperone